MEEHYVDIVGVASSILAAPTISFQGLAISQVFSFSGYCQLLPKPASSGVDGGVTMSAAEQFAITRLFACSIAICPV